MIETYYQDFKKKAERKLKMEFETIEIKDVNGVVEINLIPKTKSFTFNSAEGTDNNSEEPEQEVSQHEETQEESFED